jgi:hypothetical protein
LDFELNDKELKNFLVQVPQMKDVTCISLMKLNDFLKTEKFQGVEIVEIDE